jgi:hypothetical protein
MKRAASVLAGASLVVLATISALPHGRGESLVQIARDTVMKYALEAYPAWVATHHAMCPSSLRELDAYMDNKDIQDPYGTTYFFACGPLLVPNATSGIIVISAGEDGRFGTADDIRSDR